MPQNTTSQTWISVPQAAALPHLSVRTIEKRIDDGRLKARISSDLPFDSKGRQNHEVLLEHLPADAQYVYHAAQLNPADTFFRRSHLANRNLRRRLALQLPECLLPDSPGSPDPEELPLLWKGL